MQKLWLAPRPTRPLKLVQLAQTEPFRALDDHDGGIGHIDPHLDDGGRDHDLRLPAGEALHLGVLVLRLHPSVHDADAVVRCRKMPGQALIAVHQILVVELGGLLDERVHHVHLAAFSDLVPHEPEDCEALGIGPVDGADGLPPRGKLVDDAHVEVSIDGHAQRAWDGGGGHHEDVRGNLRLGPQPGALGHAEPVLLVDHDQAEAMEDHLGLEHRVGADKEMDRAVCEALEDGLPVRRLDGSRQQLHADRQVAEHLAEAREVLLGQDFRGGHDARLTPVVHSEKGRQQGHHGLATAHVALQQAVHVGAVARVLLRISRMTRFWAPVSSKGIRSE